MNEMNDELIVALRELVKVSGTGVVKNQELADTTSGEAPVVLTPEMRDDGSSGDDHD